jgi:hypothetical protein
MLQTENESVFYFIYIKYNLEKRKDNNIFRTSQSRKNKIF